MKMEAKKKRESWFQELTPSKDMLERKLRREQQAMKEQNGRHPEHIVCDMAMTRTTKSLGGTALVAQGSDSKKTNEES
jgi:hypothetical protein